MKKHIYIDIRPLVPRNPSGVAHYLSNILMSLDGLLDEPDFADLSKTYKLLVPHRAKQMVYERYPFNNLKLTSIYLPFRVMNLLVRKNLLPPLDLFFGKGLYVFTSFARARLLSSPSGVFIYDMAHEHYPGAVDAKMKTFLDARISDAFKANKILTISKSAQKDIQRSSGLNQKNISVIYPSVDTRIFYRRSNDEVITKKNKLNISGAYILGVGNLEPRKNIITLIHAYVKLPQTVRDRYSLVLVGASSWNSDEIFKIIKDYKSEGYKIILYVGKIEDKDMPAMYSGASLFVFPSLYEGYGIPPIEAMACGTPVISSINSAIKEAVGDATIELADSMDANLLSGQIVQVLQDERLQATLRQKGYEHVAQLPTWRDSAKELNKVLLSTLDGGFKS